MYKRFLFSYINSVPRKWLFQAVFFIVFVANVTPGFAAMDQLYLAKVSVDEAARRVNKNQKNRVLGAKTKIIEGREVHVIKTLSDKGRIKNRRIDAETGKALNKGKQR
jgi:hypothetical protein